MRQQASSSLLRQRVMAERAWANRNAPTLSESTLWNAIRSKQLGVEFKRQFVIGDKYIADFAAPSIRLVVEVDGTSHVRRATADARRDRWLRRNGWRVVRVSAELVLRQVHVAVERVIAAVRDQVGGASRPLTTSCATPLASSARTGRVDRPHH